MQKDLLLEQLSQKIGQRIHQSEWLLITQDMINSFADATFDQQWIHVDPVRAKAESNFKTTIAHGYFTLSLYPHLRGLLNPDTTPFPNVKNIINYGLNKLRFPAPVAVNSNIRANCTLVSISEVKGSLQLVEEYSVEVEGQERPACVAECIMRLYF